MAGTGEGRGVATVRMVRVCVCVCACVCVHGRVDGFGRAPATFWAGVCGVCVRVRWRPFFGREPWCGPKRWWVCVWCNVGDGCCADFF